MLDGNVILKISQYLAAEGFAVRMEYVGDISESAAGEYPAFIRVKRIELSQLTADREGAKTARAEVTLLIRALSSSRGFYGKGTLADMTERAAERIFFSADMIVKKLACGEVIKNTSLGRLEQDIELTVLTTVSEDEDEDEEDDD